MRTRCANVFASCSPFPRKSAGPSGWRRGAPLSATGAGPEWASGCSNRSQRARLSPVGDEQKIGYAELLAASKAAFEEVPDFTIAVEEEFALLDPATLGLVGRFEEVQRAAQGTELEPHIVGELIASEVEVRTGRCDVFAEAADLLGERRAQLRALADGLGIGLSSVATHPWSPWQEQRIIDTPHYRRNDELLRYVVWRNNTFGLHVDRKSTRLNSSHSQISYAVFCLKKTIS